MKKVLTMATEDALGCVLHGVEVVAVRCDRCRLWGLGDKVRGPVHENVEMKACGAILDILHSPNDALAEIGEMDGERATLWTRADFGYALFEVKS